MGHCDAMKMGSPHRVGHGEKQSSLRSKSGTAQPKQPHGGHGSKRHEREGRGEHESKLRSEAD